MTTSGDAFDPNMEGPTGLWRADTRYAAEYSLRSQAPNPLPTQSHSYLAQNISSAIIE